MVGGRQIVLVGGSQVEREGWRAGGTATSPLPPTTLFYQIGLKLKFENQYLLNIVKKLLG